MKTNNKEPMWDDSVHTPEARRAEDSALTNDEYLAALRRIIVTRRERSEHFCKMLAVETPEPKQGWFACDPRSVV